METIINWIAAHWADALGIAGMSCLLASAVTALTPTPADDRVVGKLYKIVEWLALTFGKAKELPANKAKELAEKIKQEAGKLLLVIIAATTLVLPLNGCNLNLPDPDNVRQGSEAVVTVYSGLFALKSVIGKTFPWETDNSTETLE